MGYKAKADNWRKVKSYANLGPDLPIASCLQELKDRVVALEKKAKANDLRGFDRQQPGETLVKRVARAIHPSMCADPYLYLFEARDAIAEIADWLEENGHTASAEELRAGSADNQP
jgi:hypothetical protein